MRQFKERKFLFFFNLDRNAWRMKKSLCLNCSMPRAIVERWKELKTMKTKLVLVARAIFADDCWLAIINTHYIVILIRPTFFSFCIRFSLEQFSIVGIYSTFNVHCISLHKFVIYFFVCVILFSFIISLESFVRDTFNTSKTFASKK